MIERYNVKEISEIWENKNKYNNWLKIELAILEYYKTIGRISENDFNELVAEVMAALAKSLGSDVSSDGGEGK